MHRIIGVLLAFAMTAAAAGPLVAECVRADAQDAMHHCCKERIAAAVGSPRDCCMTRTPDDAGIPALVRVRIVATPECQPSVETACIVTDRLASATTTLRGPPPQFSRDLPTLFSVLLI